MSETVNLGVLFEKARKGQLTEKQKNPQRNHNKGYKKGFKVSGIRRVGKVKSETYEQGFYFKYSYKEGDKRKTVQARTLRELYKRMIKRNQHFIVEDLKKARDFIYKNCNDEDYKFFLYVLQVQ